MSVLQIFIHHAYYIAVSVYHTLPAKSISPYKIYQNTFPPAISAHHPIAAPPPPHYSLPCVRGEPRMIRIATVWRARAVN